MLIKFPIVRVNSTQEIDTHQCVRVEDIQVCTCIFEYECHKCHKIIQRQTIAGAKYELMHVCHSCKKIKLKGHKTVTKINLNPKQRGEGYELLLGSQGETIVALQLDGLGYKSYFPLSHYNPDFDFLIEKIIKGKSVARTVQVKTSDFNHNNYLASNGNTIYSANQGKSKFDVLICYLKNYNIFYIIPHRDLESVFLAPQTNVPQFKWKVSVKTNWLHKYGVGGYRQTPYVNAWDFIKKVFKEKKRIY
jgi:hypothetical protein